MVAKKASPTERHFVSWNEKPIHIIINTVALQPPIKHIAGFRFQYGIYIKGNRKSIGWLSSSCLSASISPLPPDLLIHLAKIIF